MLKFSHRNCRFVRSVSLKFLKKAELRSATPGARSELRAALPKRYGAGTAYALGLNQPFRVGFGTLGSPMMSGRKPISEFREELLYSTGENGYPLIRLVPPVHCHPSTPCRATPCTFLAHR